MLLENINSNFWAVDGKATGIWRYTDVLGSISIMHISSSGGNGAVRKGQ